MPLYYNYARCAPTRVTCGMWCSGGREGLNSRSYYNYAVVVVFTRTSNANKQPKVRKYRAAELKLSQTDHSYMRPVYSSKPWSYAPLMRAPKGR